VLWIVDSLVCKAGTEQQMLELGRLIDSSGVDVRLATFESTQPDYVLDVFPHPVAFPLERIWAPGGIRQLWRLAGYLRAERIDIVHCFMVKSGIAGVVAGALAGTPVVLTSRRDLGYYYTPNWLKIVRLLNRGVTRLAANCEAAKRVAAEAEGFDPSRIDVLYNGVDITRFRPRSEVPEAADDSGGPALPAGCRVVGIVANYREVKDLPLFIRAAALLATQVPDAVFLLVGQGTLQPELEELAASLGLGGRIFFTGGVGSVPSLLRRMTIACLSSHSEGFSNSVLEYMATELPVVAMDVGGVGEAVVDGRTGLLIRERTPEAFAAGLLTLLKDPELAASMGRAGLEDCRGRFSLPVAVRVLETYYRGLKRTEVTARFCR